MGEKNCSATAEGGGSWPLHKKLWNILESTKFSPDQKVKALVSFACGVGQLSKDDLDKLTNYDRNDGTNYRNIVERLEETFGVGKSKRKVAKGDKPVPREMDDWRIFEEVPCWSMEWPEKVTKAKNKIKGYGNQYNKWTPSLRAICEKILDCPSEEEDKAGWAALNDHCPLVGTDKAKDAAQFKAEAAAKAKGDGEEDTVDGLKNNADKWSDAPKMGGNLMIFIFGGYTYAELQVVYELVAKYQTNVFIGGSCMWTGKTYCQAISKMADDS